jgi:hypothetical protein
MATASNLGVTNLNVPSNFVNNTYSSPIGTISTDQNAGIIGFFERITGGNKEAAAQLASAVIYTSLAQKSDPLLIVQQFMALPDGELTPYLAMFLNLNRVGTSYLGVNKNPPISKYVLRTILP